MRRVDEEMSRDFGRAATRFAGRADVGRHFERTAATSAGRAETDLGDPESGGSDDIAWKERPATARLQVSGGALESRRGCHGGRGEGLDGVARHRGRAGDRPRGGSEHGT